jgi:hypothetical protein
MQFFLNRIMDDVEKFVKEENNYPASTTGPGVDLIITGKKYEQERAVCARTDFGILPASFWPWLVTTTYLVILRRHQFLYDHTKALQKRLARLPSNSRKKLWYSHWGQLGLLRNDSRAIWWENIVFSQALGNMTAMYWKALSKEPVAETQSIVDLLIEQINAVHPELRLPRDLQLKEIDQL